MTYKLMDSGFPTPKSYLSIAGKLRNDAENEVGVGEED